MTLKTRIKNSLPRIFDEINKSRFLSYGFFLTATNIMAGGLGYAYQILVGRLLQPNDFSLFSAIMAVFMFLSAPMGAISILIIRKIAAIKAKDSLGDIKLFFNQGVKFLFIYSLIFILLYFPFGSYMQSYLKIDNKAPLVIFFLFMPLSFIYTFIITFMQGMQRFYLFGFIGIFFVLLKIVFSFLFIKVGWQLEAALFAILCAYMCINIIGFLLLKRRLPDIATTNKIRLAEVFKGALPLLVASTSYAAMTQLDMVIVNRYFSPNEAGLYAAASVLGKSVLYIPGGLSMALFPMVAEDFANSRSSIRLLKQAIKLTLALCSLVAIFFWLFGDLLIQVLYGPAYEGAGEILKVYGFAILPLAVVVIAEQYLIARNRILFAWLFFLLLPIQIFIINYYHSTIWMVLGVMGFFGVTSCPLVVLYILKILKTRIKVTY